MVIRAWYLKNEEPGDNSANENQCSPPQPVDPRRLPEYGVEHWSNIDTAADQALSVFCLERGYTYKDIITISPEDMPDYEEKIKYFYTEHLHCDDEIRYIQEGKGFFDIRDENDRWIRICVNAGDMIILPEGIYHRFTLSRSKYCKAMRLFVGAPRWTPYNREELDEKQLQARQCYEDEYLMPLRKNMQRLMDRRKRSMMSNRHSSQFGSSSTPLPMLEETTPLPDDNLVHEFHLNISPSNDKDGDTHTESDSSGRDTNEHLDDVEVPVFPKRWHLPFLRLGLPNMTKLNG